MCKRIFVIMLMLVVFGMMQADAQQLNYQAIARNANGVALTFRDVGIRLSIRDGSPNGSIVYSESRNIRTNQFGLFTVIIGSPGASNVLGSMASINWISGNKYLQVEIDPEGGTNYFQAGTSQLQAVPYALFANAAYPVGPAGGDLLGSTYPNPIIAPLAVTTGKIANQAITTPKIADLNVTTPKLADQAVTNAKIQDNTIANIKLVNSRVTLNGLILNLGDAQDFAIGTNGIDVNIVSAGNTHTFNFPDASIANRGLITPNTQTIGGNKTFNNDITAARIIRAGGLAAQFLKADGSVDNNIYLTENKPIIVTATGDATGVSTSSRTAPVLPLTLATVNSAVGTYGTNIVVPSITVNNKGLVTNVIANPIPTATAITSGLLTVGDWNIFNNKQNAIPLGSAAQYFRGDLTLSNFQTDVRNQLSAGTNITYVNGNIGLTNNSVTLNTLPLTLGGSQTFATGTTGVDFNISSAGSVHTFNIPTASVFARGLINSTDYTNFNAAYNNRIASLTTAGTSGAATLSGNVLNIPNYTYTLPAATATTLGGIISGANITNTSGTISLTSDNVINALGSQTANRFLVAPNGANGIPNFRAMATEDIPDNIVTNIKLANSSMNIGSTNISLGGTANTLLGLTSITSGTFVGPLTGNASTASAWANQRTLSLTGDVTYTSNPFDGSANTTGVATLANSGVTAGIYGTANAIPRITVDAKGRVTSVSTNLIANISPVGSNLNSGNIFVGNASNLAAAVPVTGDVTINNAGVTTIGALKITDAMLFGGITNGKLANSAITIGTTAISLGDASTILTGLTSVNSTTFIGNLTGNVIGNVSGTAGSVTNNLTFNNSGSGDASGTSFNGAAARTLSYNSIGASPLAGSASLNTVGIITAGTWNGNVIGNAYGGAGLTNGLLKANGLGTVSAATAGTDYLAPFTSKTQKFVYAAPNAADGVPDFRAIEPSDIPTLNQNTTGTAGSVTNTLTFNNSGAGDASGTSFNGAASRTLSYNSIGASPLAGSASLNTVGIITTGTWNGNVIGNAYGGAGATTGLLKANGLGTVSAAIAGTDYLAPFTSKTQKFIYAAPNAADGVPDFRAIEPSDIPTLNQNTTGTAGSVTNTLTFNNSGAGDASGTSFNGAASRTLSYNSIGASPLAGSASLNTVGIITTGTWNGNVIEIANGGTGQTTATAAFNALSPMTSEGDIIYGSGLTGSATRLAKGTNGQVLTIAGNIPSWASYSGWKIDGNSSVNPTLNFLGTTDDNPLRFRVNSTWSGELNPLKLTNSSFGVNAMNISYTGSFNTGIGNEALLAITNGNANTALGYQALKALTTGNSTTSIGTGALAKNNGDQNTAVGAAALSENTTGTDNTAIGQAALLNSNGTNNTAIGQNSLRSGTSFTNNTAIGQAALFSIIGNNNTGIGRAVLENSVNGVDNTAIGYYAGRHFGTTYLGPSTNIATDITRSVMIGSTTRSLNNISDNEIVIGHNAVGNGSNTIQLGNTDILKVNTSGAMNARKFVGKNGTTSTSITYSDPSISASIELSGNDAAGVIQFVTAGAVGVGNFITIQFGSAYEVTPVVLINVVESTGVSSTSSMLTDVYLLPTNTTINSFVITTKSPLTTGRTYFISYHVIGR